MYESEQNETRDEGWEREMEMYPNEMKKGGEMASFIVNSKDLFDRAKNPDLSLSPKEILNNPKIPKRRINKEKTGERTNTIRRSPQV